MSGWSIVDTATLLELSVRTQRCILLLVNEDFSLLLRGDCMDVDADYWQNFIMLSPFTDLCMLDLSTYELPTAWMWSSDQVHTPA